MSEDEVDNSGSIHVNKYGYEPSIRIWFPVDNEIYTLELIQIILGKKFKYLRWALLYIRDDLGLKRCTRIDNTVYISKIEI